MDILKRIEIETELTPLFSEAEWFGKCSVYGRLKRAESGLFIECFADERPIKLRGCYNTCHEV
jgi:hypothetical protein